MAKKVIKTQEIVNQEDTKKTEEVVKTENVVEKKDVSNDAYIVNKFDNLTIVELNNLLIAAEHVSKYYTNIAKANEGMYTYNTKELCADARKKIQLLETKKLEILKEIEKRILD